MMESFVCEPDGEAQNLACSENAGYQRVLSLDPNSSNLASAIANQGGIDTSYSNKSINQCEETQSVINENIESNAKYCSHGFSVEEMSAAERKRFDRLFEASKQGQMLVLKDILDDIPVGDPILNYRWDENEKQTAAYIAADRGQDKCLKVLAQHGADLDLGNIHGFSPAEAAVANGFPKCLITLSNYGAALDKNKLLEAVLRKNDASCVDELKSIFNLSSIEVNELLKRSQESNSDGDPREGRFTIKAQQSASAETIIISNRNQILSELSYSLQGALNKDSDANKINVALLAVPLTKEGFIVKQGAWWPSWKKRRFLLREGNITYFDERGMQKGSIFNLSSAFCMGTVKMTITGNRQMKLRFDSGEDRSSWHLAFLEHISFNNRNKWDS